MEESDDGYGGVILTPINISETVSFYQKRSNREVIVEAGILYNSSSIEKILATGNADIIKGDTFNVNDKDYRVSFVNSYFDICKQIELEVI